MLQVNTEKNTSYRKKHGIQIIVSKKSFNQKNSYKILSTSQTYNEIISCKNSHKHTCYNSLNEKKWYKSKQVKNQSINKFFIKY